MRIYLYILCFLGLTLLGCSSTYDPNLEEEIPRRLIIEEQVDTSNVFEIRVFSDTIVVAFQNQLTPISSLQELDQMLKMHPKSSGSSYLIKTTPQTAYSRLREVGIVLHQNNISQYRLVTVPND